MLARMARLVGAATRRSSHFREARRAISGYSRAILSRLRTDGHCSHGARVWRGYWLCKRNGLGVKSVDARGCFTAEFRNAGRNVHDCNKDIIRHIKDQGDLVGTARWCTATPPLALRSPLIYRAWTPGIFR